MSLKDFLESLRHTMLEFNCDDADLSYKVNSFIEWYKKNINTKWQKSDEIRDFIESMAVWYEFIYPDYMLNGWIRDEGDYGKKINDIMFSGNDHVISTFEEHGDSSAIYHLEWEKLFDYRTFVRGLPFRYGKFIVAKDSKCLEREGIDADKWKYQQEEMFNCVMYRLIERGGSIFGPRRAFRFAEEFGKNIDIPMMYGAYYFDLDLISKFVKAGGSKDLVCYVGYFSRKSRNEKMGTVSIQQILERNGISQEQITEWEDIGKAMVKVRGEGLINKGA